MKRSFALLLAALMLVSLAACSKDVESGPKLDSNIARVYSAESASSRFVLNGTLLEGEADGKAQIDISADGKSCLAWVRSNVYYVSEAGVFPLGGDVTEAELSFDGRKAYFFQSGALKEYSAEGGVRTVDEGLDALVQLAISPTGKCLVFTASYPEDGFGYRTVLYKDGSLTPVLEDKTAIVIAVSDDADTVYYLDTGAGCFTVRKAGEDTVISSECDSGTNYNFTRDLSEVVYITGDKTNRLFRLSDGKDTELGTGFGFTLKTDVYSRSIITLFSYINDVDSFTNGLWLLRTKLEDGYLYGAVRIEKDGKAAPLFDGAERYKAAPDGKSVLWEKDGTLYYQKAYGSYSKVASNVVKFAFSADGSLIWYLDAMGDLFCKKPGGKAKQIDNGVGEFSVIGKYCLYITDAADVLYRSDGSGHEKLKEDAAYIDTRDGQLLIYSNEHGTDFGTAYTLTVTHDGESFETSFDEIMP